ncbi:type II secretion system F family protein, partial [Pseudomonas sp. PS02288]|uniref:type II secretion system F family protein n=1 Tax=Pseudomonas sp. PS02288 TaxID=2991443 RepID=UPI00249A4D1B
CGSACACRRTRRRRRSFASSGNSGNGIGVFHQIREVFFRPSLVDALDSVSGATGNVVFKNAVNKVKADVSTGMQLNFAMRTTGVFPAMAVQMTAIGEESGALDSMLDKVATFYEEEVDNKVDGLTALMEPMIMAVLGVLVGGLIIAMYLPIFQLGSVV